MTTTATVHSRPAAHGDGQSGAVFLAPSVMDTACVDVGDFVRIATRRGRSVVGRVAQPNGVDRQSAQFDRFARQALKAYVGLPDAADRAEILRIHLRSASLDPGLTMDELIGQLVGPTGGFSGADLAFLCQNAKLNALERCGLGSDGGI